MGMNTQGSCLARIRTAIQNRPGLALTIGRFVLKMPFRARSMSIGAVARACGASPATVYRFCRDLGYTGYKEFQLDLATAVAQTDGVPLAEFAEGASPGAIIRQVFEYNRQSLADTERMVDGRAMVRIANLIQHSRKVLFLGIGASGLVARLAAQRLMSLGIAAVAVEDPYAQIFATLNVGPRDVVVGISHTGETAAIIEAIRRARQKHARTVILTNYPNSPLAREGALQLTTAFPEHRVNAATSSSIVAQLAVVTSLYFILGSWGGRKARKLANEAEERTRKLLRAPKTRKRR
jgi:DNA-binding MurR/RpiR family transcriptional regulator